MSLLHHALRAGSRDGPAPNAPTVSPPRRVAIVAGAAGTLGSAVLERALACGAFERVRVLVDAPMSAAMRGIEPLARAALDGGASLHADTAIIVFDRERGSHGREDVFHRPSPESLPALARAMSHGGVRRLIVVLPHAPALLPEALKHGLASLDEHAVAALDFEHLVIVRSARKPPSPGPESSWPQRLAHGMLAQLHWMVPQREQPVRADKVAAFVAEIACQLPRARVGSRVVAPELVWQAAQSRDGAALVRRWLQG